MRSIAFPKIIVSLQKPKKKIMAAYLNCDFKPTPMIYGEEGKRFLESTVKVKRESKKRLAEMEKAYNEFEAAFNRGLNNANK